MALFSHVVLKKNLHFGLKFHATENFAQYGWLVGWKTSLFSTNTGISDTNSPNKLFRE